MEVNCPNCGNEWNISHEEYHWVMYKASHTGIIPCPNCKYKMDLSQNLKK